jgi:hypothetical protein
MARAFVITLALIFLASMGRERTCFFDGPMAAGTLCCCKTFTGGECCTEAPKCGGKLPGCFCAAPSAPQRPEASPTFARF